jgi:hypothetical protein
VSKNGRKEKQKSTKGIEKSFKKQNKNVSQN